MLSLHLRAGLWAGDRTHRIPINKDCDQHNFIHASYGAGTLNHRPQPAIKLLLITSCFFTPITSIERILCIPRNLQRVNQFYPNITPIRMLNTFNEVSLAASKYDALVVDPKHQLIPEKQQRTGLLTWKHQPSITEVWILKCQHWLKALIYGSWTEYEYWSCCFGIHNSEERHLTSDGCIVTIWMFGQMTKRFTPEMEIQISGALLREFSEEYRTNNIR
jgi:hypothetical protein